MPPSRAPLSDARIAGALVALCALGAVAYGTRDNWGVWADDGPFPAEIAGQYPHPSPDGRTVISIDHKEGAILWDVATRKRFATVPGFPSESTVVFSPDGSRALLLPPESDNRVTSTTAPPMLIGTRTARTLMTWGAPCVKTVVSYSSDGSLLYLAQEGIPGRIVWTASGQRLTEFAEAGTEIHDGHLSPDGSLLITDDYNSRVNVWDTRTGARVSRIICEDERRADEYSRETGVEMPWQQSNEVWMVRIAASGERACVFRLPSDGSAGSRCDIHDLRTGALIESVPGGNPNFSPDRTLFSIVNATWRSASVHDAETGETLFTYSGDVSELLFTPDSSHVLVTPRSTSILDAHTGTLAFQLIAGDDFIYGPHMAPGGDHAFVSDSWGYFAILNLRTGAVMSGTGKGIHHICVLDDETVIARRRDGHAVFVLRHARPEAWWGVAVLWQVWAMVILLLVAGWCLARHFRGQHGNARL